jgi:hypothetical protein
MPCIIAMLLVLLPILPMLLMMVSFLIVMGGMCGGSALRTHRRAMQDIGPKPRQFRAGGVNQGK